MNHAGRDRMGRTRLKTARSAVRSVSASTSAQLSARAAEPSAVRVARVPGAPPAGSWPAKGKPGRGTWLTPGRASDLRRIKSFSEACPALACSSSLRTVRRAATSLNQQLESLCPSLGPEHPHVATARSNLGSVLQGLGDLEGARAQLERALAVGEAALGPDQPTVATV